MFGAGCNSWTCKVCGPRKKFILIRKIVKAKPTRFLTLTCLHIGSPEERLQLMRKKTQKLLETLRKQCGEIQYLRMLEQCKDEFPHFHFLIRSDYIPYDLIQKTWEEHTGAKIVDIRKAHGRSTGYVAKYLSKACSKTGQFSRQRISVSKKFWIDDTPENVEEWIAWKATNTGPIQYAIDNQNEFSFEDRNSISWYMNERNPGDELPTSLTPAEDETKWQF